MARPRGRLSSSARAGIGVLLLLVGCGGTSEVERGDRLLAEGRHAEAMAAWREALTQRPKDTGLLIRVATAQVRLQQYAEAEATMLQAAAIEPDSPKVRQNLALVYLHQKDFDKALATFHEVRKLQDTYPETHYYIGLIHEMRGDEQTAVKHYVQDVNNGPSRAWQRLERYKEKQRALGLAPRGPRRGSVLVFCLACFAVAAAAYALRVMLGIRHRESPDGAGN